ncbi:hypothetical protein [Kitasatospora sp. NPDC050543]|uniref:hypothetical protein n=1 Tax=Kitasatospora sp. NPDC050543 TaxID=3364054 RepID=UPI0037AC5C05
MSDGFSYDYEQTEALARQFTTHADRVRNGAGRHQRTAAGRLARTRGTDPLADAVAHTASEIMQAIKKAEDELHRHLGDVSQGLNQMARNHREHDSDVAKALTRLQNLERNAAHSHAVRPPEAHGPDRSLPAHTVTVEWKPGMPKLEFARKALALRRLSNQDKLFKAPKVTRQDGLTNAYKDALVKMIHAQNKDNKSLARAATDKVTNKHVVGNQSDRGSGALQPDHVHELQLGGLDQGRNLDMLDGYTNWHIGTQQITHQMRNLPVGTPIKMKLKWW